MVDVSAVNYTKNFDDTPTTKVPSSENRGRRRVIYDTYEAAADAIGTDIQFGKMHEGMVIHDWHVMADDLGTSVTLQLATRTDDTAQTEVTFSQAIDVATAASDNRPVAADISALPLTVSGNVSLIGKIAGGAATGTIKFWIEYAIE